MFLYAIIYAFIMTMEWLQFLILLVAEFGCFVLIFMGALIADAAERFSGWVAGL